MNRFMSMVNGNDTLSPVPQCSRYTLHMRYDYVEARPEAVTLLSICPTLSNFTSAADYMPMIGSGTGIPTNPAILL